MDEAIASIGDEKESKFYQTQGNMHLKEQIEKESVHQKKKAEPVIVDKNQKLHMDVQENFKEESAEKLKK